MSLLNLQFRIKFKINIKSMRFISLFLFIFLFPAYLFSQSPILLKIDNQNINTEEFRRLFLKNRIEKTPISALELDEYLELFVNFKLKVKEAEDRGLDTLTSFKEELKSYRSQLTKPYFFKDNLLDSMVVEVYERLQYEINASHILIKLNENAPPEDTIRAYQKALRIRDKLYTGYSFSDLAKSFSDDKSASKNGGNLGYFTALQMFYSFENAVYNLVDDSISWPIRTKVGYHLIQIHDKRVARGSVKVSHIMKLTPKNASILDKQRAKMQIDSIYIQLQAGGNFAQLAQKFSDDRSSGVKGGELPWFSSGKMIKDFEDKAFNLSNIGENSKPFKTDFGWHIVKLLDKKGLESFESMKAELASKVRRDERANLSKQSVVENLKKEYNFQNFNKLFLFTKNIDSTMFLSGWTSKNISQKEKPMFHFEQHTYTVGDFGHYLEINMPRRAYPISAIVPYIEHQFSKFVEEKLFEFEDEQLETKYPDFAYLVKEYHDGILLFNISEQEIWGKSSRDSMGLKEFYEDHKSKYIEPAKVDVSIFSYTSKKINKKWKKIEANFEQSKIAEDSTILIITKIYDSSIRLDTTGIFSLDDGLISMSGLNTNQYSKVGNFLFSKNEAKFYYIRNFIPEKEQKLELVRGLILVDYQKRLEDDWINALKNKHYISVDKAQFELLKTVLVGKN